MPKFYIQSGAQRCITLADYHVQAAADAVHGWRLQRRKMGRRVRVSEVGFEFDGDHPGHRDDAEFSLGYIKELLR